MIWYVIFFIGALIFMHAMEGFSLWLDDPWVPIEREPDPNFDTYREKALIEEEF